MTGPTTSNRGFAIPPFGGDTGTWGTDASYSLNNNSVLIDQLFGTTQAISVAGGSVSLTAAQANNAVIQLTGQIPSSTVTITFPSVNAIYTIQNLATTPVSTDRCVLLTTGAGNVISVPRNAITQVFSVGSSGFFFAGNGGWSTGDYKDFGGTSNALPAWITNCTVKPWLICDGSAMSRATYSELFSILGTSWGSGDGSTTFNVPDFRFRLRVPLDNMGGSSANRETGGLFASGNGTTVGSVGGESAHTLTAPESASLTYTSSVTDPGHSHGLINATGVPTTALAGTVPYGGGSNAGPGNISVNNATTGISVATTSNAGNGSHNTLPPFGVAGIVLIKT